jgi:hypothetical protein
MKLVKITINYPDFKDKLFQQLPGGINGPRIWGDYYFTSDDNVLECDFWVIFTNYKFENIRVRCPKENIFFIVFEAQPNSEKFNFSFINQFGKFFTVQEQYQIFSNVIITHNPNPWFLDFDYDYLKELKFPIKTKSISIISSNKENTPGHKRRLEFVLYLKKYFGNNIDLFGRGLNDFTNKEKVLLPYKFNVVIENSYFNHYYTEKLTDALLTYTFPIYYGCPNLNEYFSDSLIKKINICDVDASIKLISKLLDNDENPDYVLFTNLIVNARNKILDEYQFFPFLVSFFNKTTKKSPIFNNIRNLETFTSKSKLNFFKKLLHG